MIKETNLKLEIEKEEQSDGGLESLLKIVTYFNEVTPNDFQKNFQKNYTINSLEALNNVATNWGLLSVVCDNIDIPTIIKYNKPLIIGTTTQTNKLHFVVCYSFTEKDGFLIWDSRNDFYCASIEGIKSLWNDKKCMAFYSNK